MCLEYIETDKHERKYVRHAIKAALEQPVQEQVSPAEFIQMTLGKETVTGIPAYWAEWPSKE